MAGAKDSGSLAQLLMMFKISILVVLLLHPLSLLGAKAAAQSAPPPAGLQRQRAISLYKEQKYEEARVLLLGVVKQDKEDYLAWYYLGFANIQHRKHKDASKAFETALKLRPDFAAARSGLGYSLLFRNKFSESIRAAQAALSLDPNLADAYYVIGVAHLRTNHQAEAINNAEKALKVNPQFAAAYLLISQAHTDFVGNAPVAEDAELPDARRKRFEQAANALEKYLALVPESKLAWGEQLENLRVYSRVREKSEGDRAVFYGKEVTTKARVISKPEPEYIEIARANGTAGRIVLRAVFAADGSIKHILVVKGLPDGLTEVSVAAARRIKFVPATINGRNVSMYIQLEYNFMLY